MTDSPGTRDDTPEPISNTRILIIMACVAVLGAIGAGLLADLKTALGVAIGGFLAFVNYYWMKRSIAAVLGAAEEGRSGFGGAGYIIRYLAFGVVLAILYLADPDLIVPVILGLSSFAVAVVIEGMIRIFGSILIKQVI